MPLTDAAIRNAKPTDQPYKLADERGLFLLVNPTGSRLWRFKYRVAGKEKMLAIGAYPDVSLALARKRRDEAREALAAGRDPSEEKKAAKAEERAITDRAFSTVAAELVEKLKAEGLDPETIQRIEWMLKLVEPDLGTKRVDQITAPAVLAALKKIEARGKRSTALRTRSTVSRVFRFAMATARATTDPTIALAGALTAPVVKHRPAIVDPKQLGGLMRAVWSYEGQPETGACLKLLAYLVPRPGELRQARWDEFDLDKAVWVIPAARTKMRREHRVPLPRQAVEVLRAHADVVRTSALVFPSTRSADRPISENTTNAALRRLGYAQDEATSHGFRASFSTIANEAGVWNPDAIERHLAHVEENKIRRAYARGEHWEERVRMAQWWADYLDRLRTGAENVVEFRERAS
ncbi:MAG TPA: integrase arm-type DNA-binding domain-containing protein [Hyphomicrobium zavarzinii]|nr:integrase arm-type DNA-binding domain-containing protein [Hyphomicrobium zavarzinii]